MRIIYSKLNTLADDPHTLPGEEVDKEKIRGIRKKTRNYSMFHIGPSSFKLQKNNPLTQMSKNRQHMEKKKVGGT